MKSRLRNVLLVFTLVFVGVSGVAICSPIDDAREVLQMGNSFCQRHQNDLTADASTIDIASVNLAIASLKEMVDPPYKKYVVTHVKANVERFLADLKQYESAIQSRKVTPSKDVYDKVFQRYFNQDKQFGNFAVFFGGLFEDHSWAKKAMSAAAWALGIKGEANSLVASCHLKSFFQILDTNKKVSIQSITEGKLGPIFDKVNRSQSSFQQAFPDIWDHQPFGNTSEIACIKNAQQKVLHKCKTPPLETPWPTFNELMNIK